MSEEFQKKKKNLMSEKYEFIQEEDVLCGNTLICLPYFFHPPFSSALNSFEHSPSHLASKIAPPCFQR